MFGLRQPEPPIQGRPLKILNHFGSKKHYWGQKGGKYGFFTSEQEKQMIHKDSKLRRIQTLPNEYIDPIETNQLGQYFFKNRMKTDHHTYNVNSQATPKISQKRLRIKVDEYDGINEFVQQMPKKFVRFETPRNHKDFHLESKNIEIKLPAIKPQTTKPIRKEFQQYPQQKIIKNPQRQHEWDSKMAFQNKALKQQKNYTSQIHNKSLPNNNNERYYYYRKPLGREFSPTFCNSLGYPLPCYRYSVK